MNFGISKILHALRLECSFFMSAANRLKGTVPKTDSCGTPLLVNINNVFSKVLNESSFTIYVHI